MKQQLQSIASILAIVTLCFAGNAFAARTDNVLSSNIKEADGTSGQDTNSGDGVKTGHIQDGAVTDAKISDVSMGKVTGLLDALAQPHYYGNYTVVATSGGEYSSPVVAMSDIGSWCGTPSASNTCLIKIMPGTYDMGSENIMLKSNVSIVGSGAAVTKITSDSDLSTIGDIAATATNVSLTGMTIENTSTTMARGIMIGESSSLSISDVALITVGGAGAVGINVGKYASLAMNDSTIQVSAPGNSVGISGVDHKIITVSDVTIDVSSTSITSGSARGVYTYSYWYGYNNLIDLNNVTVNTTTTGAISTGVMLTGYKEINGTAKLANVKSTATGGSATYAAFIQGPYNVTMNGVTGVAVDGTSANYGVVGSPYGYGPHTVEIMNSSFTGATVSADNGASTSAEEMSIANTKLDGPVNNGATGILKCIGTFDGNFDAVVCP